MSLKQKVIRFCSSNAYMAMAVANLRAEIMGLLALPHRIRWWGRVRICSNVKIVGARRVQLGNNSVLSSGCWLNVNDRFSLGKALVVGENCFIGQDNFFTVGASLIIGDYCLTTKNCAFIGSAHVYSDPTQPYAATGTLSVDKIYIGSNCFFATGAQVIGNVRVGHGCVVGAGAVIKEDIPPFSLVVGSPAQVIKRFDFQTREWVRWPAEAYQEGPDEQTYLKQLQKNRRWILHPISAAERRRFDLP